MIRRLFYNWFGWLQPLHVSYDNGERHKPTVVFIHGIGSSAAMWQHVVTELQAQSEVRIIGVDLLGFGKSPKPAYIHYTTNDQAMALAATLRRRGIKECIIVGHSLGSLVAIEFAKLHPIKVRALVLGSPPFYTKKDTKKWLPTRDSIYQALYRRMRKREERMLQLGQLLSEKRPHSSFMLNEETLPAFMKTLEKSIEHQTSLQDAINITIPIAVIYGSLDPVVLFKNIKLLQQENAQVTVTKVTAGHEINQRYAAVLLDEILKQTKAAYPTKAPPT